MHQKYCNNELIAPGISIAPKGDMRYRLCEVIFEPTLSRMIIKISVGDNP
jgi:hypothetical protein